ncbi:hypothetical protein SAMN05421578_1356 [Paenibacillus macquariensis]|uniref:Uncharacterized protein n=1 Tax=Paenibacillus macquariensis TaxID=948756 RepID=A0ABY1KGR9_9BACL|nr:hypothetical protein SAMN05421578_1356 [Paenibacillus macquariensis]
MIDYTDGDKDEQNLDMFDVSQKHYLRKQKGRDNEKDKDFSVSYSNCNFYCVCNCHVTIN